MHKTTFSASLDYFVTSSPPYLHQFSTISGGNCIKDSVSPNSTQVILHVLNNVLKIKKDGVVSISKWMEYRGYDNFTDLCGDFLFELNHTLYFSDYRVDGQNCALKFGIMNKLKLFISWMSTRMREATSELYAEHLLALTHEQFNDFRQEVMIRMSSVPTASPPGPTTPMTPLTNQPSRSKQRLTRMHIPWGEFPEQPNTKKLTIEHNKKVKLVNAQKHSTFGNPKPKPSSVVGKSNPQPQQNHFHDNYPSPDNPPQAVDKSCHLSDSTSTTDSLDE